MRAAVFELDAEQVNQEKGRAHESNSRDDSGVRSFAGGIECFSSAPPVPLW